MRLDGSWDGAARKLSRLLRRAVASMAVSGASGLGLSLLGLRTGVMLVAAAVMLGSGVMYRGRAETHRRDDAYRVDKVEPLLAGELRLSRTWIVTAIVAIALTLVRPIPIGEPVALASLSWWIYLAGWIRGDLIVAIEEDEDIPGGSAWVAQRPLARRWLRRSEKAPGLLGARCIPCLIGRKRPVGEISAFLTLTLLLLACSSVAFAGIAASEILKTVDPGLLHRVRLPWIHSAPDQSLGRFESGESGEEDDPPPTYAELCSRLPDPDRIGARLGELFRHDGAVEAGCGTRAEDAGGSTLVSRGICAGDLRSLAVVGDGHPAVLIYGAPARFASGQAREGELRYAEVAHPYGGELDLVGTAHGTYVFARPRIGTAQTGSVPRRCEEVDAVAAPFTMMPPPLAALWREAVLATGVLLWPEAGLEAEGSPVVSFSTGPAAASIGYANRRGEGEWVSTVAGVVRETAGPATVTLSELSPFLVAP